MPKVLDYFDGGFYLNLDSRPDRRLTFEARSNEQSLTLERFSVIEKVGPIPNPNNDPNWHFKVSCTDSHFSMIRLAKERGWKTCLIFEDDCIFASDFSNKVRNCLPEIDKTDWTFCILEENRMGRAILSLTHWLCAQVEFMERMLTRYTNDFTTEF
jgi:hypothetical protein